MSESDRIESGERIALLTAYQGQDRSQGNNYDGGLYVRIATSRSLQVDEAPDPPFMCTSSLARHG